MGDNHKRSRDEPADFPGSKRIREILEDDDGVDFEKPVDDLDDVIRSLEEEIKDARGSAKMDLGFLLEASDDELGLPPAVVSEPSSVVADGGDLVDGVDDGGSGFDRIWGFEDENLDPYAGLGPLGFCGIEGGGILENADLYYGGLFGGYNSLDCGPLDYEDL